VPAGGWAEVLLKASSNPRVRGVDLVVIDPPEGVAVQNVTLMPEGMAFQLQVDESVGGVGTVGNLIVEGFAEFETPNRSREEETPAVQTRRISLGMLPAIPFVVVQP
jgi:hypothetical protein